MTMAGMLAQRASYAQTRILILVVTPAGSAESTQRKAMTRLTIAGAAWHYLTRGATKERMMMEPT